MEDMTFSRASLECRGTDVAVESHVADLKSDIESSFEDICAVVCRSLMREFSFLIRG